MISNKKKILLAVLLTGGFLGSAQAGTKSLSGTVRALHADSNYVDWEKSTGEKVGAWMTIYLTLDAGSNAASCNKGKAFVVRLNQSGGEATYAAALTAMHNKTRVKVNVYTDCNTISGRQEINYIVSYPPK